MQKNRCSGALLSFTLATQRNTTLWGKSTIRRQSFQNAHTCRCCCCSMRQAHTASSSSSSTSSSSSSSFRPVRGMHDIFEEETRIREGLENAFVQVARRRGYGRVETPIVESSALYARSLGESSDVVMKEMYTFVSPKKNNLTLGDEEKGGAGGRSKESFPSSTTITRSNQEDDSLLLALRPEGTAGIIRALGASGRLAKLSSSSSGNAAASAAKLYYSGPMFRHERPQRGRYRQFTQFGIEHVSGSSNSSSNSSGGMTMSSVNADIEVLSMADTFLRRVLPVGPRAQPAAGRGEKGGAGSNTTTLLPPPPPPTLQLTLLINTLGANVAKYSSILHEYFTAHQQSLSHDSQARLARGAVLRILDSKSPQDAPILANAPVLYEHLDSIASKQRFDDVLQGLRDIGVPYTVSPRLVRGLDYYSHTVFEFIVEERKKVETERNEEYRNSSEKQDGSLRKNKNSQMKQKQNLEADNGKSSDNAEATTSTTTTTTTTGAGQLGTVLAGGRYDKLAHILGYTERNVSCVGWAAGAERLSILGGEHIQNTLCPSPFTIAICPITPAANKHDFLSTASIGNQQNQQQQQQQQQISSSSSSSSMSATISRTCLRIASLCEMIEEAKEDDEVEEEESSYSPRRRPLANTTTPSMGGKRVLLFDPAAKIKTQLSTATSAAVNAHIAIIVGEDEMQRGVVTIKDLRTSQQQSIPLSTVFMTTSSDGSENPSINASYVHDVSAVALMKTISRLQNNI